MSIQFLVPDYYDEFQCLADKCPYSCCKGWTIRVDKDSYDKYQQADGELGEVIRDAIESQEECYNFKLIDGSCAMLDKQGLCRIQSGLGEDFLCNTCISYPRAYKQYGKIMENFLKLSCPEVARILLSHQEPITFLLTDEVEGNKKEESAEYWGRYNIITKVRSVLIDFIQSGQGPLWKKIFMAVDMIDRINQLEQDNQLEQSDNILNLYTDNVFIAQYAEMLNGFKGDHNALLKFYLRYFEATSDGENIHTPYLVVYNELRQDPVNFVTKMEGDFQVYWQSLEIFQRNFFVYYIYAYFLDSIRSSDLMKTPSMLIWGLLIMKAQLFVKWKEQGGVVSENDVLMVISVYARMLEHNSERSDSIYQALKGHGMASKDFLLSIL